MEQVIDFFIEWGYVGIFLSAFLAGSVLPFSSELVLVALVQAGLSPVWGVVWATAMSALVLGGSIQYVAVTLLTTAFDPLQAFLLSLMVNARHLFYGLSLLDKYRGLGRVRPFLIST